MANKLIQRVTIVVIIVIIGSLSIGWNWNEKIEMRAKEFMNAGMYEQAKVYLSGEIEKHPQDPDLYFLLGKCHLACDEIKQAQEAFDKAILIDYKKGNMVGTAYLDEGKVSLEKGDADRANRLFILAAKYDPSLKPQISAIFSKVVIESINNNRISEAETLSNLIKSYAPESTTEISKKALERAKALASSAQNWPTVLSLAKLATSLDKSDTSEWGSLMYQILSGNYQSMKAKDIISLGDRAIQWNPSIKDKLAVLYLEGAKQALKSKGSNPGPAAVLLDKAISMNKELKSQAGMLILNELSNRANDMRSLGRDGFLTLFNACDKYGVPPESKQGSQYQLFYGLKLYEEGAREKAISIFEMLASKYPDTAEASKALEILALPVTGKIEVASEPLKIKTHSSENSGEITFQVLYVDVEENGIKVTLSIRSVNKEKLLYARKNWEDSSVGHIERPCIVADNGKKAYTESGINGGEQTDFNDIIKQITINPEEETVITASFPMVSKGTTKIKVYLPELKGWQEEWHSDWIKLKAEPFE